MTKIVISTIINIYLLVNYMYFNLKISGYNLGYNEFIVANICGTCLSVIALILFLKNIEKMKLYDWWRVILFLSIIANCWLLIKNVGMAVDLGIHFNMIN